MKTRLETFVIIRHMRARILPALSLVICLLPGCRKTEPPATTTTSAAATSAPSSTLAPPTPAAALQVIGDSAEFSDFHFTDASVSIPMNATSGRLETGVAHGLAVGGWVTYKHYVVELTDKAKNDPRFIVRSNNVLDVVPLAQKHLIDVLHVVKNDDGTVSATFTWHWEPNDLGSLIPQSDLAGQRYHEPSFRAVATLTNDGYVWSVQKIEDERSAS